MIVGGLFGSVVGAALFRLLQASGQIDVVIGFLYVLLLGCDRRADAEGCAGRARLRLAPKRRRSSRGTTAGSPRLPLRWRFYSSGLYISPLAPLALGFVAGMLTVLARHRRRLHPGSGDDLPARHGGARRDRHQPRHDPRGQRGDDHGPCADHPGGRHRACRPAARRRRGRRAIWRAADDAAQARPAAAWRWRSIILLVALRMALGLAWRPDEIFTIEYL